MSQTDRSCIFCQIVKREIPSKVVFENDEIVAFHDINPKADVHVLLIPKIHIESISKLVQSDQELAGKLLIKVKEVAEMLGIADGYNVLVNNGQKAGQKVPHLHFHILSGWKHRGKV